MQNTLRHSTNHRSLPPKKGVYIIMSLVLAAMTGVLKLHDEHLRRVEERLRAMEEEKFNNMTPSGKWVYASKPELKPSWAVVSLYKKGELKFGHQYEITLKAFLNPENDPNIQGGIADSAYLMYGHIPQATPNLAMRIIMSHSELFVRHRPPVGEMQTDEDFKDTPEATKPSWEHGEYPLKEHTELCLEALESLLGSDNEEYGENDLFARRIEARLQEENKPNRPGIREVTHFFIDMDLTDIAPEKFAEFLIRTKLDQSTYLRAHFFPKLVQKSDFYRLVEEHLPPFKNPIKPLERDEIEYPFTEKEEWSRNTFGLSFDAFRAMRKIMEEEDRERIRQLPSYNDGPVIEINPPLLRERETFDFRLPHWLPPLESTKDK